MPINSTQDFEGLFTMDVPLGQHYADVAWCRPNGRLGCEKEFWEDNAGCQIDDDEMVIFYYDNSQIVGGESNAWQHAINDLTTSYLYEISQNDEDAIVLTNDIEMQNLPQYLVGKVNNDGSKVVFVGGYNLDDLKSYANSVAFK
jgi:hypothetical protein